MGFHVCLRDGEAAEVQISGPVYTMFRSAGSPTVEVSTGRFSSPNVLL